MPQAESDENNILFVETNVASTTPVCTIAHQTELINSIRRG